MSEPAVKKRLARAKQIAREYYRGMNYGIVKSDDSPFCFTATRFTDIRLVRVVVDRITDNDLKLVRAYEHPMACAREIYCQKEKRFEIREVRE